MWWVALHLLAAAATAALERGVLVSAGGTALIAAHALARRPRRPPDVYRLPDGAWVVPAAGLGGGELSGATECHSLWVRLELRGGPRRVTVLLLRDQLDPETWRRLQVELRRRPLGERGEGPVDFS